MKHQAIQYLALDVHQSTVVATLRDAQGDIILRATVATNAKAILALAPERACMWRSKKGRKRNGYTI